MRYFGADWSGADGISETDSAYRIFCEDARRALERNDGGTASELVNTTSNKTKHEKENGCEEESTGQCSGEHTGNCI